MGLTFRLGQLPDSIFTDTSNNVGIGAAPSGSYKLEVTGTAKVSSTLLLGGALSGTSASFSGTGDTNLNINSTINAPYISFQKNSVDKWQLALERNTPIYGMAANDFGIYNATLSTVVLKLANSTGAATFSAALTAASFTTPSTGGTGSTTWTLTHDQYVGGDFGIYNPSGSAIYINASRSVGIGTLGTTNARLTVAGVDATSSNYSVVFNNNTTTLFYLRNDGYINTGLAALSPYNYSGTGRSAVLDAAGGLAYLVSTRESKANIESIKSIDFINQLNPVQFNYRKKDNITNTFTDEVENNITYGFIADEVENVNKELVFYNEDGSLAGVEYNSMIAILTKAIQEQQATITSLQDRLTKGGL